MKIKYIICLSCFIILLGCNKDAQMEQKNYTYIKMNDPIDNNSSGLTLNASIISNGKENLILDYGFIYRSTNNSRVKVSLLEEGPIPEDGFSKRFLYNFEPGVASRALAYVVHPNTTIYSNEIRFFSKGSVDPIIESIIPDRGFGLDTVEIRGRHFSPNGGSVVINGYDTKTFYKSDTLIRFIVPHYQTQENCLLTLNCDWRTIATNEFCVLFPKITSVSTNEALPGTLITLYGENFICDNYQTRVYFGGEGEIFSISEDKIEVIVPPCPHSQILEENVFIDKIYIEHGNRAFTSEIGFTTLKMWKKTEIGENYYFESLSNIAVADGYGYFIEYYYAPSLYRVDVLNNKLDKISDHPDPSEEKALIVIHDKVLYEIGGRNIRNVWTFDLQSEVWEKLDETPFNFTHATSLKVEDYLLIITNKQEVWKYTFLNNDFEKLTDFPVSTNRFVHLYYLNNDIIAGTPSFSYIYDQLTDTWTEQMEYATDIPSSGNSFSFVLDGSPFFCSEGGGMYRYDLNRWIRISSYPWYSPHELGFFIYENKPYFITISEAYVYPRKSNLYLFSY